MTPKGSLSVGLRIVRLAAFLVPRRLRSEWLREWEAELWHESTNLEGRRSSPRDMNLVARAFGSFQDAVWLRRQFTLDADAVQDSTHAARMLLRTPGFTAIALLVFAVGIGSTTAMVSIADALMMRPMPVRNAEDVMTVWQHNRETGARQQDVAPGNALDWLARARSFETAAIAEPWTLNTILPARDPEYLPAAKVSDQFFNVLGTTMFLGRTFLPVEHQRGGERVAILSHDMWRDRFGSDPAIVGRSVRLDNDDAYTIVGVTPRGLELRLFDSRAQRPEPLVWLPKQGVDQIEPTLRGLGYWNVVGRLRAGVSIRDASAELEGISQQLSREFPQTNRHIGAQLVPLRSHLTGSLRQLLPLLLAAAAALLIVACANVANLLLARGVARGREFAVRQALGASRMRLVRQMLVETLILAAAGGLLGLGLAQWLLNAVAVLRPLDVARIDRIPLDARAAAIACAVAIVAALIAGLAPALQLSRPAAASKLKDWRGTTRSRTRGMLVALEVAATLVLLVGAGLLVRSFILIQRVDPGFKGDDVALLQVFASTRLNTPEKRIAFFDDALERIRAVRGVSAAGGVTSMPFGEARVIIRAPIGIAGRSPAQGEQSLSNVSGVSGDYFRVMGVPLLKGRFFEATDTARSRQVVLVSKAAARHYWPDSEPIGSRVQFRFTGQPYDAEVIGVVGDVQREALDRAAVPEVYLPYSQSGFRALTLVASTTPGAGASLQQLNQQIWAIDPLQSVFVATTLNGQVAKTLIGRRFSLLLVGGFAIATLVLACAGVYGLLSFTTSQRTREFGVRIALGAGRGDIIRLVLKDGLTWAAVGVTAGALLAFPLMRLLRSLLFGVTPSDPLTFAAVCAGLVLVVLGASFIPARRAMKVAPIEALRLD